MFQMVMSGNPTPVRNERKAMLSAFCFLPTACCPSYSMNVQVKDLVLGRTEGLLANS